MQKKLAAAAAALSVVVGWSGTASAKPLAVVPPAHPAAPARVGEGRPAAAESDRSEAARTIVRVSARLPFGAETSDPAMDLYREAQGCQNDGRRDEARRLYQQVHLLSPASWLGQQAMRNLQNLESDRFEESEEPPTPSSLPAPPSAPVRPLTGQAPSGF